MSKICSHCKEGKSIDQFHKNRSTKDGFANMCKHCKNGRYNDYAQEYNKTRDSIANRERVKAWQKANPEKNNAKRKRWYDKHGDDARAQHLTWRHNRLAKMKANGGSHTTEEWLAKLAEFDGSCVTCGSSARIERDHIIPVTKGGTNDIENIQPLCLPCNRTKGAEVSHEQ